MTSASLFFKLQKEDLKRRIWVIALLFLGFFFAYPVNLALIMENAANSQFAMYNGYTPLVDTGTPEYLAKVLEYKTKAVVDLVSYGNVMPLFLMVTAAVVIGAAGFVYLHNQKKVDFYHSLPVRREMLYLVYHVDGILILAVTYLIHLLVLTAAAAAYGVSPAKFAGPMLFGFFMNLLYYMVTYETVIVAMMMTGKIIVGLLATVVFFSFFPVVGALIEGFEDIFFITANQVPNEALFNTLGHLSPVGAYIMSLADISAGKTVEADQILGLLIRYLCRSNPGTGTLQKNVLWKQQERQWPLKRPWHPSVSLLSLQLVWEPPCFSGLYRAVCAGDSLEWLLASF